MNPLDSTDVSTLDLDATQPIDLSELRALLAE